MVARYDMPFGWYLRGSLYCVFRSFPVSLFLLAMVAAGYYAVYRFPLTILFVPGLYSAITVPTVRKRIVQFGPPDQEEEEEPEQDEMK
jgi:quinol-cytochrome oxidoreductase complex cytochrome b subunit